MNFSSIAQSLLSNPAVQAVAGQALGATIGALLAAVVTALIAYAAHNARAATLVQIGVDLAQLADPLVRMAEASGRPGPMKAAQVERQALEQLAAAGYQANVAELATKFLPAAIAQVANKLFPPKSIPPKAS